MQLGKRNKLTVNRITPPGAYLTDEYGNEVLLPNKYLTDEHQVDAEVEVFVFKDSENRIISTTEIPHLYLGDFAYLEVVHVNPYGAFADWGLDKNLFIPFREQPRKLEVGDYELFTLRYDHDTDRLFGSMNVKKLLEPCENESLVGQEVDLLICEKGELGQNVIVENRYSGLIFNNLISRPIQPGERTKGFVKTVRPDGKIDIQFEPLGVEKFDNAAAYLLEELNKHQFLPFHDKSSPDEIRERFGMSKKLFKQAVGQLFKAKKLLIEEKGIRLNSLNKN